LWHKCRLNMKSGSVTDGQIPFRFWNNKRNVDEVSIDSGTCPQGSGLEGEIEA
jgi:hypothetical protein